MKTPKSVQTGAAEPGRRAMLIRAAIAGLSASVYGLGVPASAASVPDQPQADTGHSYPMARANPTTDLQFRTAIVGTVHLSRRVSGLAVDKASSPRVREFGNFELRETIAVSNILASLNTPIAQMDAIARRILSQCESATDGNFDRVYMHAQLGAHEYLRDTAQAYLSNSAGSMDPGDAQGRRIAMLSLAFFKEHVVLAKEIIAGLMAG